MSHTVTAGDGSFGGIIAKGKKFSYTFNKLGTYDYHCNFHKGMTGSIIVTE
ncbi:hypothetical protein KBC03_02415 [Patescibacteria group bacterium]|nr:hypothetical protein [Patescibacteria group bacterium]